MSAHVTKKKMEYGSMTEISVPIPMFLSYCWAKAMMIAKYVISGVMMFVDESATRYAMVVSSGEYPSYIMIGTNIGTDLAQGGQILFYLIAFFLKLCILLI